MSLLRMPHLLLGAAIVLHGLALWQILNTGSPPPYDLTAPSSIALPAAPSAPELTAALGGRLFYGGSAAALSDGAAPPPVEVAGVPPPPATPPSLAGTASGGRRGAVAILRSAAGTSRMLRVGESLDGWRVVAISGTGVTVRNGDDTRQLRLAQRGSDPPSNTANAGNVANASAPPINGTAQ